MKEFGKNLLKGVQIGLGICVSLVLVWWGISFAAAAWGALPSAGTYNMVVNGSNASTCPTSSIDKIYSWSVKLRLLNAD